jgi:hypothetical protein
MFDTDRGHSARSILLALGMGDYNATMVIPYLFMAPAQTDPQMAQIILLTEYLQKALRQMGAPLPVTRSIDAQWAPYVSAVAGRSWPDLPWAEIARYVLEAKARGKKLAPQGITITVGRGGLDGALDSLPKVPGGLFTYAVGGYLLWRHMKKGS